MGPDDRDARDEVTDSYHRPVYGWEDEEVEDRELHGRGLDFGLLLLRLGSLLLLPHGLAKAADLDAFVRQVGGNVVGGQAPELFAWLIMLGQIALPVLLAIGLFTRPSAFLTTGMMLAIWSLAIVARLDYTPLDPTTGALTGEPALLYAVLTLPLVFTGAGRWSADAMRTADR